MSTSKSEYLVWKQAAEDACETMSEYARKAVKQRFEQENPHKLGFGEEFRMNSGTLAKMVGTVGARQRW